MNRRFTEVVNERILWTSDKLIMKQFSLLVWTIKGKESLDGYNIQVVVNKTISLNGWKNKIFLKFNTVTWPRHQCWSKNDLLVTIIMTLICFTFWHHCPSIKKQAKCLLFTPRALKIFFTQSTFTQTQFLPPLYDNLWCCTIHWLHAIKTVHNWQMYTVVTTNLRQRFCSGLLDSTDNYYKKQAVVLSL